MSTAEQLDQGAIFLPTMIRAARAREISRSGADALEAARTMAEFRARATREFLEDMRSEFGGALVDQLPMIMGFGPNTRDGVAYAIISMGGRRAHITHDPARLGGRWYVIPVWEGGEARAQIVQPGADVDRNADRLLVELGIAFKLQGYD